MVTLVSVSSLKYLARTDVSQEVEGAGMGP